MTDKAIDEMSDTEIQRVIAELRGWTGVYHKNECLYGIAPEWVNPYYEGAIPNWPQDTHAAVIDLLAECEGAKLAWWFGDWEAYFPITATTDKASIAESNHPARAISEAWLAWKRGKDGR